MKKIDQTPRGRILFRPRDLFVVLAVLVVAGLFVWAGQASRGGGDRVARVYYEDRLIREIELVEGLAEDHSFSENPRILIRQYGDGTVAFVESDCPDKVCVRTGRIGRPGEFAACVPNRFLIVIAGVDKTEGDDHVDLIA